MEGAHPARLLTIGMVVQWRANDSLVPPANPNWATHPGNGVLYGIDFRNGSGVFLDHCTF